MLTAVLAVASYDIYYRCATADAREMLTRSGGEMEWLRREYHLSNVQFERIQQLHREYTPKCELMCERIANANARLDRLISSNKAVTPELEVALRECASVRENCRQAMLGHIYAVAAQMSPEAGTRYLEMMKNRLIERPPGTKIAISESAK